ncbi:hypothetical protein A1O3_04166 [Capronia epimyces CBS 606.96]|uniref:Enoyl reductase (ER) domain-containing protein n=1 Tax=Capronia epimyces CBS 606.96 TaxID=1182542 RepID=W9Y310_9EURO|nr:uncharacterized protein A1O3_04166 [Capronia epimyces CBS 606.96]EXJ87207.1 hypothetical protein A1O3_04166 [Capronia epimyces CBS 606.96]
MEAWAVVEHNQPLQKIHEPLPQLQGSEVLIQVSHCAICHSDLHFWEGFYDLGGGKRFNISDRGVKLPRAIGHEIAGVVAQLGPDAAAAAAGGGGDAGADGGSGGGAADADAVSLAVGDRKIVYPWLGCGQCRRCLQGDDHLCGSQRSLGVMQHGGFASHVVVPHPKYLVDPGSVDPAVACTFACSGLTVLSALTKILPLAPTDPIVLVGAGGLGLAAISVLRAKGHASSAIISIDLKPENRAAAVKAGAATALDGGQPGPDLAADVLKAAGGPVLGVVDFVNNSSTAALAYAVLGKGGKMVQVGVMGGELTLSLVNLIFKGATIMGNNTGNLAALREVTDLARQQKLAPIPVTTVPWDQANEALMRLRDGKVTGRIVLVR